MGIYFSDSDFDELSTNIDAGPAEPFAAYLVCAFPSVSSIGGFEVGIDVGNLWVTAVSSPGVFQRSRQVINIIRVFDEPPSPAEYVVLTPLTMLTMTTDTEPIRMFASEPSSVGGAGPAIYDYDNPDDYYVCNLTTCYPEDHPLYEVVATVNGDGVDLCEVVATRGESWSGVKSLFE